MTQLAKVRGLYPNETLNLGGKTISFDKEAIALVPLEFLEQLPLDEYTVLEIPREIKNKPTAAKIPANTQTTQDSTPLEGEKLKRKRGSEPKTLPPKASSAKAPKGKKRGRKSKQ